jgi:UDP:flavonoid glycosyltransferase YjiC (YdhE family)
MPRRETVRYLFCSFTTPGFLFPMAGLALELRGRGHDVAFVSGPSAKPWLDEAGLSRLTCGPDEDRTFDVRLWGHVAVAALGARQVEAAVGRFRPDVMVSHQLCEPAVLVRERQGVPLAVLGLASYLWPVARGYDLEAPPEVAARRQGHLTDNLRILNEARAMFRLPPVEAGAADHPLLGDLFMLRTVPALEPQLDDYPAQVHAVGACLWEPPRDDAAAWAALRARFALPDAPLLYVQPGRGFGGPGFWPLLVEALRGEPVQVVASTARMDTALGEVPRNFVADGHVLQGPVLRRADAAASGSTTAILGAAACGVPSLVLPVSGERVTLTHLVESAGFGARVDAAVDAEELLYAVRRVMASEALLRGARRAQAALAELDGFGAAADLVERLGREGGRVVREEVVEAVPSLS